VPGNGHPPTRGPASGAGPPSCVRASPAKTACRAIETGRSTPSGMARAGPGRPRAQRGASEQGALGLPERHVPTGPGGKAKRGHRTTQGENGTSGLPGSRASRRRRAQNSSRHRRQRTLRATRKVGPGMGSSGARYKAGRHVFGAAGLSHYSCGPRGRHSQVTALGTGPPAPFRAAHILCCRLIGLSLPGVRGAPRSRVH